MKHLLQHKPLFIGIMIMAVWVTSCQSDVYLESEEGLRYRYLKRGESERLPQIGDMIICHYDIRNEADSSIYSTYRDLKNPDQIELQSPRHKGDIFAALSMMSVGDSMAFEISADSFYRVTRKEEQLPPMVRPGSYLTFTIKVMEIYNQQEFTVYKNKMRYELLVKEVNSIDSFFEARDWNGRLLNPEKGVRYYLTQETNGKKINTGSVVHFHFIGTVLTTGSEFVNSYFAGKPATFRVGDYGSKPEVMHDILMEMREGEKGVFVVPFDWGYGSGGLQNIVPPYATIMYEINVLSVE
jgi:FKBP-type peptidyl-prolyl cis-trans isomerase FkpA